MLPDRTTRAHAVHARRPCPPAPLTPHPLVHAPRRTLPESTRTPAPAAAKSAGSRPHAEPVSLLERDGRRRARGSRARSCPGSGGGRGSEGGARTGARGEGAFPAPSSSSWTRAAATPNVWKMGRSSRNRRRTGCTPCCRGWQTWTTTTPCPVGIVVCDVRCPSSTPLLLRRRGLSRAKSPLPPPGPPPPSLGRCLWTTRRQRIAHAVTMKGCVSILVAPQLWARRARGTARFQGPPERLCGQAGNVRAQRFSQRSASRRHPEARPACWVQRPANVRARP